MNNMKTSLHPQTMQRASTHEPFHTDPTEK